MTKTLIKEQDSELQSACAHLSLKTVTGQINSINSIFPFLKRKVMQRYPMSPSGTLNIDVKDVEEAPVEEEYDEYLSTVLRQQNIKKIYIVHGHQFVATVGHGVHLMLRPGI